jgi:subtilase-type serine protease
MKQGHKTIIGFIVGVALVFSLKITAWAGTEKTPTGKYHIDAEGRTTLHWAAITGNLEMAKQSLAAGIDIDLKDARRRTALDYAVAYGHTEIAILIHPGAIATEQTEVGLPAVAVLGAVGGISKSAVIAGAVVAAGTGVAAVAAASEKNAGEPQGGGATEQAPIGYQPKSGTPSVPEVPPADDSHSEPEHPTPPLLPSPLEPAQPEHQPENKASWGLVAIGAEDAYSAGLTGKGVVVAHLSKGIWGGHPEFQTQLQTDLMNVDQNTPLQGRELGTQSAGIIIAQKDDHGMQGIAYGATLAPFESTFDLASIRAVYASSQLHPFAVVHHDISEINEAELPEILTLYHDWTDTNQMLHPIMVVAAGDNGEGNPGRLGRLPALDPALTPLWLTVVSVDQNHHLSHFSNACGSAKNWCLAAPGNELMTTSVISPTGYTDPTTEVGSTALATAHVSGAAALLMQLYPQLTPTQVVSLLLASATDLGESGIDGSYGYGLLNIKAALEPLGDLIVQNTFGTAIFLGKDPITTGGAFGGSLRESPMKVGVMDSFGRLFQVALPIQRMGTEFSAQTKKFSDQVVEHTINFLQTAETPFQTQLSINQPYEDILGRHEHPFLQLVKDNVSMGMRFPLGEESNIALASVVGERASGGVANVNYQLGKVRTSFEIGTLHEPLAVLGSDFPKLFTPDYSTTTYFSGIGSQVDVTPNIIGYASYYSGKSQLHSASSTFSMSRIGTHAIGAGIVYRGGIVKDDEIELSIAQPLRLTGAKFSADIATGYNTQGEILFNKQKVNVEPSGREIDFGVHYNITKKIFKLYSSLTYRHQPLHSTQEQDGVELMVVGRYLF